MEIIYLNSYLKSIKKVRNEALILNLEKVVENIEKAQSLSDVLEVKKLRGFSNYYRIKIDDFRLGVYVDGNNIHLVQFLHRKDIYKKFP